MKNPLLLWSAILVGLQVLTAGAALSDVIGAQVTALCVLVVAALQAATTFYVRGQVTPNVNVAAAVVGTQTLAGPASGPDVAVGQPVTVKGA